MNEKQTKQQGYGLVNNAFNHRGSQRHSMSMNMKSFTKLQNTCLLLLKYLCLHCQN